MYRYRLIVITLALLAGTAGADAAVLRVAAPAAIADIDPNGPNAIKRETLMADRQIYDPLLEFQGAEPVARLATSWQQVDDRTWRFTLRTGVKFQDGSDFDAADVVATVVRQSKSKGGLTALWNSLESATVIDPQTVEIKMKQPVGAFLRNTSLLQMAPSEAIAAAGDQYGAAVVLPGTGPFAVKDFQPGQSLTLVANKGYWDGAPKIDGIDFLYVPELSGRITGLLNNEIDVTWNIPDDQIASLQGNADIKTEVVPSVFYLYAWFNPAVKPFDDVRVRQALWHAIDINQVVKDLLPVTGKVATAPIASTVFGYAPQQPYAYDPDLAKKLLAEAGYPNGFTAEMKYPNTVGVDPIAQTFSAYWEAIGAHIRPLQMENAAFGADFNALKWDMMMSTNPTYTEDAAYTLGRLYVAPDGKNGENNYVNADVTKLLLAANAETDQAKRKDLYAQAEKIIWDEAPGIFPAELSVVYAYRSNVSGVELAPTMAPHFRGVTIQ